jgi:hypothetical protein
MKTKIITSNDDSTLSIVVNVLSPFVPNPLNHLHDLVYGITTTLQEFVFIIMIILSSYLSSCSPLHHIWELFSPMVSQIFGTRFGPKLF